MAADTCNLSAGEVDGKISRACCPNQSSQIDEQVQGKTLISKSKVERDGGHLTLTYTLQKTLVLMYPHKHVQHTCSHTEGIQSIQYNQ